MPTSWCRRIRFLLMILASRTVIHRVGGGERSANAEQSDPGGHDKEDGRRCVEQAGQHHRHPGPTLGQ